MICCGLKIEENYNVFVNQFPGDIYSKTPSCRKIKSACTDVK